MRTTKSSIEFNVVEMSKDDVQVAIIVAAEKDLSGGAPSIDRTFSPIVTTDAYGGVKVFFKSIDYRAWKPAEPSRAIQPRGGSDGSSMKSNAGWLVMKQESKMIHVISGRWIFIDDEQVFRVHLVDNGKPRTVLAASPFSHDINRAVKVA
jgi:hypothetical protein